MKAFQLAVDINDYDLFIDIFHAASNLGIKDLADASMIKAQAVYHEIPEGSNLNDRSPSGSSVESDGSLPPPPPTPPPTTAFENLTISAGNQQRPIPGTQHQLPGPMQLFSAVTTVQVQHPPPAPLAPEPQIQSESSGFQVRLQQPLAPQLNVSYAKTTSAKKISTSQFQVRNLCAHVNVT